MQDKHHAEIFLAVFLVLAFVGQAYAATYRLPHQTRIRNGLKVHFGDCWINTTGTDIHITAWFVNDWMNYTVDGAGTQEIFKGAKPERVYIDGVNTTEGNGWTFNEGTITLTSCTISASLTWTINTTQSMRLFIFFVGILTTTVLLLAAGAFAYLLKGGKGAVLMVGAVVAGLAVLVLMVWWALTLGMT
jgi:hypothetical protein